MKRTVMIKCVLFFVLASLPLAVSCQSSFPAPQLNSVGITFAPEFTYRTLTFSDRNDWVAEARNKEEIGNYGFTAGALVNYSLGKRVTFETGVMYANKSTKTKYKDLEWPSTDQELPSESQTLYHFKYITIPIDFNYNLFATEKVNVFAATGLSVGLFLSKKTKVVAIYPDGDKNTHASTKQVGYSRFNLFATVGAGIDYRVSKQLVVRVEPFYQRSLTSITADDDAKEHLFSFGVTTGVFYSF
jgi:hypothetical protein